jgi:hypothetical protein
MVTIHHIYPLLKLKIEASIQDIKKYLGKLRQPREPAGCWQYADIW